MSGPILEIHGLNKSFGPTYANRNIDFTLERGEIRGLIGENGSGKSTLLSQIAGIYPLDSGEMFIGGEPYRPKNVQDAYARRVSMVLQELGGAGNLPVDVDLVFGGTKHLRKFGIVDV
ncbi:MAG: ATP-binding cassette domain-containing protein, partial [Oscillospiraceae bacterium]|nr:ATP-binding cassette domain-containing protein [Oscillospiraceae bacterium]